MSLIQTTKRFTSKKQDAQEVILLCGFGGAIWQTKRLISVLNRAGYNVTALDFPRKILSAGDPVLLPRLVNEVVTFVEDEARKYDEKILLIGISLGSLLSLNIFRRSKSFDTAIMLTGGNIVTVAKNIYGHKTWPQTHEELSEIWKEVNIFTDPSILRGKRALFVLPLRDKLIDTSEVLAEIGAQNEAGNSFQLVKRARFSHVGTIIEETIIFPGRILDYIQKIESKRLR